jgi:hypothetical protein
VRNSQDTQAVYSSDVVKRNRCRQQEDKQERDSRVSRGEYLGDTGRVQQGCREAEALQTAKRQGSLHSMLSKNGA